MIWFLTAERHNFSGRLYSLSNQSHVPECTYPEQGPEQRGTSGPARRCAPPLPAELGNPEPGELGNWESYWLIEFGESLAMKLAVRCCRIQF